MKNAAYTVLGIILAQANNREEQTKASDAFRQADAECSTDKELLTITTGWLHDGLKYGNWPWTDYKVDAVYEASASVRRKASDSKPIKTGIPLIEEQLYNAKAERRDAMQRLDATAAKKADGEITILERRLGRAKARAEAKGLVTTETTVVKHDYEPGEVVAPMQTDPSCRVCGMTKQSTVHA